VSPSKLEQFERSPVDWFVDRVAGGEPLLAGAIGTMLHAILEHAGGAGEAELLAALEGRWNELDFEADWIGAKERRLAERMTRAIARYLADRRGDGAELLGGETTFEFAEGRALVHGSIDRIERDRDGRVRVVDLKTGSKQATKAEAADHAQLGLYQLAVLTGAVEGVPVGAPHAGAALLYVRGKTQKGYTLVPQAELDEAAALRMRERVREAAEGMAAATFEGLVEPEVRHGSSSFRALLARIPEVCGE
jgi:RecB family exonuclease